MSLTKKRRLTPERLAANQANAQLSHGPVTAEGLERSRQAMVKHGFYSKNALEALRTLGEDPGDFAKLHVALLQTWGPRDGFENRLVEQLARAIWRLQRSDRLQESLAVTQLKRMDARAGRRARRQRALYERKLAGLKALLEAASRAEFATTQIEIDMLASAYGGKPKGRADKMLASLLRLAPVQTPRPELSAADGELALAPVSVQPLADGPKRKEVRGRLQALLREEIDALEERRAMQEEALLETTSPYYRDVMMVAAQDRRAVLMARMEEASLRQIERLTKLLTDAKKARKAFLR